MSSQSDHPIHRNGQNGVPRSAGQSSRNLAGGRPRALDDAKRSTVCALVSAGVTMRDAARYVGCHRDTIRREVDRNPTFREEVERAKVHRQLHPLRAMHQAAGTHWRAAAWWLERTQPERFARKPTAALTRRDASQLVDRLTKVVDRVVSNPTERERLHRRLAKAMPDLMRPIWDKRQAARKVEQQDDCFGEREGLMVVDRLLETMADEREQALPGATAASPPGFAASAAQNGRSFAAPGDGKPL